MRKAFERKGYTHSFQQSFLSLTEKRVYVVQAAFHCDAFAIYSPGHPPDPRVEPASPLTVWWILFHDTEITHEVAPEVKCNSSQMYFIKP